MQRKKSNETLSFPSPRRYALPAQPSNLEAVAEGLKGPGPAEFLLKGLDTPALELNDPAAAKAEEMVVVGVIEA